MTPKKFASEHQENPVKNISCSILTLVLLASFPAHADIVCGETIAGPHTGSKTSVFRRARRKRHGASNKPWKKSMPPAASMAKRSSLRIKSYDDACDPKQAVTVANKMASSEGIQVRHCTVHAQASVAGGFADIYGRRHAGDQRQISTNPKITDDGEARLKYVPRHVSRR